MAQHHHSSVSVDAKPAAGRLQGTSWTVVSSQVECCADTMQGKEEETASQPVGEGVAVFVSSQLDSLFFLESCLVWVNFLNQRRIGIGLWRIVRHIVSTSRLPHHLGNSC